MPQTATPPDSHVAVLELPDAVRLSGRIYAVDDTGIELRDVRLVGGRGPQRLSLKQGSRATLLPEALEDDQGPLDRIPVTVSDIKGGVVLLRPDSAHGTRCHRALSKQPPDPVAVAVAAPPVSAQGSASLQAFEQAACDQLRPLWAAFIDKLPQHLKERASAVQGGDPALTEAARTLSEQGHDFTEGLIEAVRGNFRDLVPAEPVNHQQWQQSSPDGHTLDLVDIEDFEDFLAVDRMINMGREWYGDVLECLTVRLATAIPAPPLDVRLPVHIAELCTALQALLSRADINHRATSVVFDAFLRLFMPRLEAYYRSLNQGLIKAGIYPDLEEEISAKGSVLDRARAEQQGASKPERQAPESSPIDSEEAPVEEASGNREPATPAISAEMYQSVLDALNFQREALPGAAPQRDAPAASADSVLQALDNLQRDSALRQELRDLGSLRQFLSANSERFDTLRGTAGSGPDSINQLDLVDTLFSTIHSQMDVSEQLQPTLSDLQVPLAKLALQEPRFFIDNQHAARGVIDKLAQLAAAGNFPNRMLEGKVTGIIEGIVAGYDRDTGVFDTALEEVDRLVQQQVSAQTRNVERVIRTQEGQYRLRQARAEVDTTIRARLGDAEVPQLLLEFIQRGWRDLLVLTWIKQGTGSASWQDHLRTIDLLGEWLEEQREQPGASKSMQHGLEADPFIDMLEQQVASELPANIELAPVLDELRLALSGERPVTSCLLGDDDFNPGPSAAELQQRLNRTRRLRRWVKRVQQLETGSWLSYRDPKGVRKRMQLAWISPDLDHFIFVNERGQKVAEMNAVQLARHLSRGAKPPSAADQMSLVDQSLYGTLESVQETLNFSRNHDQLTRLINRRTFEDQVARALRHADRKASRHAVLHLNIDQFKLVNEVYDEVTGDQVLMEFAKLLSQLHGSKMSTARLQEDSFGILLVDHDIPRATAAAEKIRADIESGCLEIEGDLIRFTVSVGIAPIGEDSADVETILAAAESAMYQAKDEGRNRVAVAQGTEDGQQQPRRQRQAAARHDLEQALATDRFVLRAQPIVKTALRGGGETSHHYELLLGIRNAEGEIESPENFILAAERHGFMTEVDRWVVREAFQWISRVMDAQKVVPNLAINLSGISITNDDFMEYLFEQISEFGVGTNRLCFEITETGTITNLIKAADFVRAFRNIGCKFSLDDFGTGLASHSYLRELPVDYVKIDGMFITGIHENRNDFTMTRSINDLAHFLGQETIAESVESEPIIVKLEELGVDYLQGWGIGRPRLLEDIAAELSSIEK
ncbi:DUF1631 family protein [Parahaliea aestuarii]|uniref:DUF1631 family protein n=1 Tax=Parahaliea aestuarii TaxID=1852021 RepID=A0A5C8ZV49_9GAMM|nr:DUF1631 family protein [Parahaliea aestuarii]TXS91452.1 DUF1631 family protein [Parahaliea aestuarii]